MSPEMHSEIIYKVVSELLETFVKAEFTYGMTRLAFDITLVTSEKPTVFISVSDVINAQRLHQNISKN